jgi:chromosome segregation ATPase
MQSSRENNDVGPIFDEQPFRDALSQIDSFVKNLIQTAGRQRDMLLSERESSARDISSLRKKVSGKDEELENLRKIVTDLQVKIAEARRNGASKQLEAKQLAEQLNIYKTDRKQLDETEKKLRDAREQCSRLQSQIEAVTAKNSQIEREHKTEIDQIILKYEQEKVQLHENVQIAEERARTAQELEIRSRSQVSLAEKEKKAAIEELSRGKQNQKLQVEQLRSELARREAAVSEQDRRLLDMQREYERKLSFTKTQTEQTYQSQIESLKTELQERIHEINHLRYQLQQEKEDHNRAMETLKQDMTKQIDLRADEIRRQYMLKDASLEAQKKL